MNSLIKQYKKVLSIAGSDPSGGAGIQADTKTISACGGYAMTTITAVTVQNTQGVRNVHLVPPEIVEQQIEVIAEDIAINAVKLGMLPTEETVRVVAAMLRKYNIKNIVVDPIMVATSGDQLIDEKAVQAIQEEIFPIATLITPNIPETEFITGVKIHSENDFSKAADKILDLGAHSVLIKAGHLKIDELTDHLYEKEGERWMEYQYSYDRIDTPNTHGTGCTLSSAIATFLALDYSLPEAVGLAEDYIHKAILSGAEYTTGKGHGPVHHFFRFWE